MAISPSLLDIVADLALLQGDAHAVRTYTVESTLAAVPRLAAAHDLNVTLGAWIGEDKAFNDREIRRLADVLKAFEQHLPQPVDGGPAERRSPFRSGLPFFGGLEDVARGSCLGAGHTVERLHQPAK